MILDSIKGPDDVKSLNPEQLPQLAQEIRERIINVTAHNGGHVGPNLGVVELTIAMHRVFSTPRDRFVFDVSHQAYVHKLLTGRNGATFDHLRTGKGLSGFMTREESPHDCYGAGHAGTALSAALGMATGRDLNNSDEHIVALIGDAALTCGITMEALNNLAASTKRLVVILNDNEWSIAKNVGAISHYLNELITTPAYNRFHDDLKSFLNRLPGGEGLTRQISRASRETKDFLVQSSLFEKYKLRYLGPIDGHDLTRVEQYLDFAKNSDKPVLLHVLTKKGKGLNAAIDNPEKFHGTSPFDPDTGKSLKKTGTVSPPAYQDVFGEALTRYAQEDRRIIGITAAMPSGTGLTHFEKALPEQFYDVGIAEEHAVLFAAGLATQGIRPVCAIYSTFLQRSLDPIIHDVCLQNLPVVFCMDRAGLSPNDGPTHHGVFDISYLRYIPHAVIMQPRHEDELCDMLHTALRHNGPTFIRYPRGAGEGVTIKKTPSVLSLGKAVALREGKDIVLWALGGMVAEAERLAEHFELEYDLSVGVVNARFVKPLDKTLLLETARKAKLVVTLEDHVRQGGFGSAVVETLQDAEDPTPVLRIGWPDNFIAHGSSVNELRAQHGLTTQDIRQTIHERYERLLHKTEAQG